MGLNFKLYHPMKTVQRIVGNDKVGKFTAETWGRIFKRYTPADTKTLSQSYRTEPNKVIYYQPYSHYQWEGVSRSGRPLNYSKERNFDATDHWEQAAYKNHKNEVSSAITEFIRRM